MRINATLVMTWPSMARRGQHAASTDRRLASRTGRMIREHRACPLLGVKDERHERSNTSLGKKLRRAALARNIKRRARCWCLRSASIQRQKLTHPHTAAGAIFVTWLTGLFIVAKPIGGPLCCELGHALSVMTDK